MMNNVRDKMLIYAVTIAITLTTVAAVYVISDSKWTINNNSSSINHESNITSPTTDLEPTIEESSYTTSNKGMVEGITFRNPVTIRLFDDDGNLLAESKTHNTITDTGITYILDLLYDPATTPHKPPNKVAVVRDMGDYYVLTTSDVFKVFKGSDGSIIRLLDINEALVDCLELLRHNIPERDINAVECVTILTFRSTYRPAEIDPDRYLNLNDGVHLLLGYMPPGSNNFEDFEIYFVIETLEENVPLTAGGSGTIYHNLAIGWGIQITP